MKTGIFVTGLGQSFLHESVDKYTQRLMNEMSYATKGVSYTSEVSKVQYTRDRESTVITIIAESKTKREELYRLYEFNYNHLLTERVANRNLLIKNLQLFFSVFKKTPVIWKHVIRPQNYNHPGQTFYLFTIYLLMAMAVFLLIPSSLEMGFDVASQIKTTEMWEALGKGHNFNLPYISKEGLNKLATFITGITTAAITLLPNANVLIINLATEFLCANNYLEYGTSRELIQGNLDKLLDYVIENDPETEIHLHAYSFGTIVAIDHILPYSERNTKNTKEHIKGLITIGSPYEFINAYYPSFYSQRIYEMNEIKWLNIYSVSDALASNFRNDKKSGEADYGISQNVVPDNMSYEVYPHSKFNPIRFYTLFYIRVHGRYWDSHTDGQSCLRLIMNYMCEKQMLKLDPEQDKPAA